MAEIDQEPDGFLYAIQISEPRADFWDIEFPAPHKADEALARLPVGMRLATGAPEVVYLNEFGLSRSANGNVWRGSAKHCDTPSIWIEAQSEIKTQEKSPHPLTVEERVIPRRNRTRVKARVLACIRRRGFQEEVAVCEDLSKGGLSFRSRNEYPQAIASGSQQSRLRLGAGRFLSPSELCFRR